MNINDINVNLHHGDCLEVLRTLPDNSVDAVITDPPYGLSFMDKKWDYDVPSQEIWAECLRVLKPGGHLLSFAGTRTQHRMAVRIEDAGFEIRDMIAWIYGSGFPKSLNLKNEWQGWGTALKPALEPITVARKPLIGTVAENVLAHGTGALNIDATRVGTEQIEAGRAGREDCVGYSGGLKGQESGGVNIGRWPANLIHDGSDEVVGLFPYTKSGNLQPHHKTGTDDGVNIKKAPAEYTKSWGGDKGSAARFFYCSKASKRDRDEGLDGFEAKRGTVGNKWTDQDYCRGDEVPSVDRRNHHPTVKPTDLMRYLCRLVTPPGGVVLDPFMGSGSTGKAAKLEGFSFIGIEREAEYHAIAAARIKNVTQQRG